MNKFLFFYSAGLVFSLVGYVLIALGLVACLSHTAREHFRAIALPFVGIFLVADCMVVFARIWELGNVLSVQNPYERFTFFHSRGWLYWLELIFTFVPQLLWIPRLNRLPGMVLLVAGASILGVYIERFFIVYLYFTRWRGV